MATSLRVLLVEDSEDDATLTILELKRADYDPIHQRVETAEALRAALEREPWDIALCDYNLPRFGGREALALSQELRPEIPVVILSGQIGEDAALECLKAGARDVVLKGNLGRLAPVVERESSSARLRQAYQASEEAYQRAERDLLQRKADEAKIQAATTEGGGDDKPARAALGAMAAGMLIGLYLTSLYDYLQFHSIAEVFSIAVAFTVTMVAWNSRRYMENPYLVFIGIGYGFVSGLDLLHTLSYTGMNIFRDYPFYANQVWIAARSMQSLTLLVGFSIRLRNLRINYPIVLAAYAGITGLAVLSIFVWKVFPVCFVEGTGQTPFKIVSEYVIIFILVGTCEILRRARGRMDEMTRSLLMASILVTALSEAAFTLYTDNYGITNLLGHYLKIIAFYLMYQALVRKGISQPYALIFHDLRVKEFELAQARDAAVAASRAKSDFLASMSHELRTPLNAILGFGDLLGSQAAGPLTEKQLRWVGHIVTSGKHLLSLINDILDLSKVEAGKLQLERSRFPVKEALEACEVLLRERAMKRGVALHLGVEPSTPAELDADQVKFKQIFFNLLSNAVKFTPEGGSVRIVAKGGPNGGIEVSVADTGPGIRPEDMPKVFQEFSQLQSTQAQAKEGTGLALLKIRGRSIEVLTRRPVMM